MKDLGTVESTIRPDAVALDEYHVYVASDITEYSRRQESTGEEMKGFSYHLVEYTKDEYIKTVTANLTEQTTSLQEAVTDLYDTITSSSAESEAK